MQDIIFLVLCGMQVADWYSTRMLVNSGTAHEANPVMAFFIKHFGVDAGILLPKAVILVMVYLFLLPYTIVLFALCAIYAAVLVNNFHLVKALPAK